MLATSAGPLRHFSPIQPGRASELLIIIMINTLTSTHRLFRESLNFRPPPAYLVPRRNAVVVERVPILNSKSPSLRKNLR